MPIIAASIPGKTMLGRLSGRTTARTNDRRLVELRMLVDNAWYLRTYPDVADAGLSPDEHFAQVGIYEQRDPSPLFRHQWYKSRYPDVQAYEGPLICHFLDEGGREGRSPSACFDTEYYLAHNPDIAASGMNPLIHYLETGHGEGRRPSPLFDDTYYKDQCPLSNEQNAWLHYLTVGGHSGYDPHRLFSTDYFLKQSPTFITENETPLEAYLRAGIETDLSPHILFEPKYYIETNSKILETGRSPLADYLGFGAARGSNPHPLFFTKWYCEKYLGGGTNNQPLEQYITHGDEAGNQPNPYFFTHWYKENYISETGYSLAGSTALSHYITTINHALDDLHVNIPVDNLPKPNPWFHSLWYLTSNEDIINAKTNPLSHYCMAGSSEYRSPGPDFDPVWYTQEYLGNNEVCPLRHFIEYGAAEGKAPNSDFNNKVQSAVGDPDLVIHYDTQGLPDIDPRQKRILEQSSLFDKDWYAQNYLTPNAINMDPVEHYLIFGANLGYNPGPDFNSRAYRSINHDLRSAAINPLLHYIQHGRAEGRHATRENRDNEIDCFRFSKPEYGPITDILAFDSDIAPPENLTEKICLHLHLFHTDMADEFCEIINRLIIPFTLVVSIQSGEDEQQWTEYFSDHITFANEIHVRNCVNQGRDVQPWLVVFKDIIRNHDIFCHLHTKKSGYNKFQKSWRRYLAHTTFGERTLVNQILTIFSDDPTVGLIFPAYFYILRNQPNYGKNYDQYERLYTTLFGDLPEDQCPDYPAGSFFWARTSMLEPLFALDLTVDDFDQEGGQVDGTTAHALERILGALPAFTNHTSRCIAVDVPFDLVRYIHPARVETLNQSLYLPPSFSIRSHKTARSKKRRIAVYSAITGGYESFVKPLTIDPDIDYFLFSDTPEKFSPDWATVIDTPFRSYKPVRTARYVKTHPHYWFADYDYAIWMDANVLPVHSLLSIIDRIEGTVYHAGFIQHPLRYNCMEEGAELIKFGLDDKAIIEEQLTRYGKIPHIFGEELIETNLFVCRPGLETTKTFMNHWWSEINNYSHRDQLSINYAIMKSRLKWKPLFEDNISLRDHAGFFLLEHEMANRDNFMNKIVTNLSEDAS